MKIDHRWVLEAKIGLNYANSFKNGLKMTIFDLFKSSAIFNYQSPKVGLFGIKLAIDIPKILLSKL